MTYFRRLRCRIVHWRWHRTRRYWNTLIMPCPRCTLDWRIK